MAEATATFKPVPSRTPQMQKLKIANKVYRELVKVKGDALLSVDELADVVQIAMGEIRAEFPTEKPVEAAAAS